MTASRRLPAPPDGDRLGLKPTQPIRQRDAAVAEIKRVIRRVRERRQGESVSIIGGAGHGKTRLAQEGFEMARRGSFLVTAGTYIDRADEQPYSAFHEVIRGAVRGARSLGFDLADLRVHLALLRKYVPEDVAHELSLPEAQMDERGQELRLFGAFTDFFAGLASQMPVALMLDNLHSADSSSHDLFDHLACQTRGAPILLLATAREVSEDDPLQGLWRKLESEVRLNVIHVSRLEATGTEAMARDLLRARARSVQSESSTSVQSENSTLGRFVNGPCG